jgi:uncharacterized membrane protein YphA (DoxX/SURF4 family)
MRISCKKRANVARRQRAGRKALLLALTLVLGVSAIRETWQLGAQCSGEAKVSIERNGPNGTFAGDRPDASDSKLVVTFTFRGTCWATGSFYLTGGEGPGSRRLPKLLKSLVLLGRTSDANLMQKRANVARRQRAGRKALLLALTLVLGVSAIRETWQLGAQCSGEAKVSIERNGPNGTFAGDR